jgi:hypothetical protein
MSHNIALPTHRYVYVLEHFVLRGGDPYKLRTVPAIWWGVSVTPNRTLGCHLLLENGAMVVDVPFIALRWKEGAVSSSDAGWITWDCYGWDAEIVENDYLANMRVRLLTEEHELTAHYGNLWFGIDHRRDGFSTNPSQHKHLWVVAMQNGTFSWVPQDQMLLHDKSFTEVNEMRVPPIKRQSTIWSAE